MLLGALVAFILGDFLCGLIKKGVTRAIDLECVKIFSDILKYKNTTKMNLDWWMFIQEIIYLI